MDMRQARRYARNTRPTRVNDSDYFPFGGGLNLVDTPLAVRPGQLLACKNYEPGIRGGYTRLRGYERYDGRLEPSQAHYWILGYDAATAIPANNAVVTGATSSATGVVLNVVPVQAITHINRALWSSDPSNAAWTKNALAAPTTDPITNPLGTQTYALVDTVANASHEITQTFSKPASSETWRVTATVRAAGVARLALIVKNSSTSDRAFCSFGLGFGGVIDRTASSGWSIVTQEITTLGSSWWRISLTVTTDTGTSIDAILRFLDPLNQETYAGDGVSGIYLAGAQVERAPASTDTSVYVLTGAEIRGNGAGEYVLGRLSGTFQDNEDLDVSSVTQARANGLTLQDNADTDDEDALYRSLAIAEARAQIQSVPGEGPILGTVVYHGVTYAFRNNVGSTAAVMWKSTPTGWAAITINQSISFNGGLAAGITAGATITGATSGATAVVKRVVVQTGAFTSNDAAGYLILGPVTAGPFQNGENLQISASTRAVAVGANAAQTLLPNGRYEFRIKNFYGHTSTERLYGVDGVNKAFEYQDGAGEFFAQITTGMTFDSPTHLAIHQNRLYLAFEGGSLQNSGVGDPLSWQVVTGAAEIALGEEITGLLEEVGTTLFIFGRNRTAYLGLDTAGNAGMFDFNPETGAFEWTIQRIGQGIYLDDRGFSSLSTSDRFGNYIGNSFSALIQPLIELLKLHAVSSCIVRDKNLYRIFFDDGRFISIGLNGKKITGITLGDMDRVVRTVYSGEDASGNEMIVWGSDDGYVYRAERGTSFDGEPIQAFMRPVFHFSRTPSRQKRYRRASFDIATLGRTTLQIGTDYSFADPNASGDPIANMDVQGGGGFWDVSIWNQFRWDTGVVNSAIVKLEGSGVNIGFIISNEADDEESHSITGVTLHHSMRRINRGTTNA